MVHEGSFCGLIVRIDGSSMVEMIGIGQLPSSFRATCMPEIIGER